MTTPEGRVNMATLCQIREDGSIAGQWELLGQPLVVGRGEGADAQVEDGTISRRHAVILHEADNYSIEDLGSQNGTWVDGRRVLTARLNHNARILIGRTQFLFLVHRQAAVTGAPTSSRLAGPEKAVPQVRPVVSVISRPKPGLTEQH